MDPKPSLLFLTALSIAALPALRPPEKVAFGNAGSATAYLAAGCDYFVNFTLYF